MQLKLANLIFSPAAANDAGQIADIINSWYNTFDNKYGFLAGRRSNSQILSNLSNYYTAKSGDEVIGLVQTSKDLPEEFEALAWNKNEHHSLLQKYYEAGKFTYIVLIAVKRGYCGMGAGKFIYGSLFNMLKDTVVFSSVIVKPYNNLHSLHFHKHCGFEEVAYNNNDVIGEIPFESVYLARFPQVHTLSL